MDSVCSATLVISSVLVMDLMLDDEVSLRVRTKLKCDADGVDTSDLCMPNRSATAKVQNHHVTLSACGAGGEWRCEWLTELQAMQREVFPGE